MNPTIDASHWELGAVAGDRDALAHLLVEHAPALARRIRVRLDLNPFADFGVEDVLQEVFLDAFRGIGTYRVDQGKTFQAWISKVADNRMASMLRHRSRRKRGGRHPAIAPVASPLKSSVAVLVERLANPRAETGSQSVARDEMVLAIREGLAALPGDQRAAVEAYYLQGLDLGATAEELTKTPAAVRGLLHRAKQALRETLGRTSRWFYIR